MASTCNDANDECAALKLNDLSLDPPSPTELSNELPESKDMESSTDTLHSDASTTTVEEVEEQTVRLYVSGLARSTTKGCLEQYFAKHNPSDVMLKDRGEHTPYKFAFLTVPQRFAQSILEESPHIIGGVPAHVEYTRTPLRLRPSKQKGGVNPKPIIPDVTPTPVGGSKDKATVRKLFLGGLSSSTTTTQLNAYFSAYGEVVDS